MSLTQELKDQIKRVLSLHDFAKQFAKEHDHGQ